MQAKDAERVRKPKLPKKKLLRKPITEKSKPSHAHDGAEKTRSKHKTRERTQKFCPKCGSSDVSWASGLPQLWSIWDCKNCGYRGALILEDSKLAEKLREEYARKTVKH